MKKQILLFACFCVSMILQAQVSKTVAISAGELSTVLTSIEKNTIVNITINGTVDARDFKVMRDEMPVLSVANLSGASIVAYSGNGGTASGNNTYYVNAIPNYAFFNPSPWSGINKPNLTSFIFPSSVHL